MVEIVREILKVFSGNNLFDEGVELVGSWCFKLYQKHIGVKSFPLRTPDIDFLIPVPFYGKEHPSFLEQLEKLGFKTDFNRDGSIYLWNSEPKKWKAAILRILGKAKIELPLLGEDIDKLQFTLQEVK